MAYKAINYNSILKQTINTRNFTLVVLNICFVKFETMCKTLTFLVIVWNYFINISRLFFKFEFKNIKNVKTLENIKNCQ